ncbi:MAG: sigma-E factor negative regulatory protein [Halothiobacillaceae bacterium]|jgi:sigma-E factor negative regulatory protein RseA|nr:sigma-E factor negative regulatory protein [Halothiobacillaceae bacterium]MDD3609926.1 sigma-E factor negative regulatory protein [Halothiobacillaceae bacterium]MDY0049932.1 sigma-E factor negative regulatory protein [Halothiobacillaceae bacterium]
MTAAEKSDHASVLLDGELKGKELEHALDALVRDTSARESLERYELIGQVMRGEHPLFVAPDFSARVMAALADEGRPGFEPLPQGRPGRGWRTTRVVAQRWSQRFVRRSPWVAGAALAASVAAVTVVLMPTAHSPAPLGGGAAMMADAGRAPALQAAGEAPSVSLSPAWASAQASRLPSRPDRMDPYLMTHYEQAASSMQVGGMLPGARLASYPVK